MERHRRFHWRTGARQIQRAATAKAETEHRQLRRIDCRFALGLQLLERSLHTRAQQCTIILERHHRRTGLISVLRTHGLTVNISDQHHVALGRHRPGDFFSASADAHPVRRHQQTRAGAFVLGVECKPTFIRLAINLIDHGTYCDLAHF